MTVLGVGIAVLACVVAGVLWAAYRVSRMTNKQKKALLKKRINDIYIWAERVGILPVTKPFDRDYLKEYPELALLEENYDVVREECLAMLGVKEKLTDISAMGGSYTQAGIHVIKWKSFMFKSGEFIESNCDLCPRTAAILKRIPKMYTAFFSVIDPHQYVTPHWGYYKGFLRYHLGVVIPGNNANGECWLRVNGDPQANAERDPTAIEKGEVYHWKNGEGILFDDNYLHDAANESDEVRVVLWLDMRRKMPFYLQWFNMLCLAIVHRDKSVRKIRENALVEA